MNRYEKQKEASRQAILQAALTLFRDDGYYRTNVEAIITEAGVSRATFYKHFKSKFSLAEALAREMMSYHDEAFDALALIPNPDFDTIAAWLESIIAINARNKDLLAVLSELFATEPRFRVHAQRNDTERIQKLSRSIPAFRRALADTESGSDARAAVQILLYEIDTVLFRLRVQDWQVDKDSAVRFLAKQVMNFIGEMG